MRPAVADDELRRACWTKTQRLEEMDVASDEEPNAGWEIILRRLLANVEKGLTRHFPTWRTSQGDVWDMRKRMQWCMTPLGVNMLAADAVEYAELELFLSSFDQGKPMSVPGIRH